MPGFLLCMKGEVAESTWLVCSGRLQIYDATKPYQTRVERELRKWKRDGAAPQAGESQQCC